MIDILYKWLNKILSKKKHDVVKLNWKKAELEKHISDKKNS